MYHGDMRPSMIGMNKDKKQYFINDRLKNQKPADKAQTDNLIDEKDLYMSPDLYKRIEGNDKDQNFDPQKNDLFSLGMILLQLGTMKSQQNLYKPKGEFDVQ